MERNFERKGRNKFRMLLSRKILFKPEIEFVDIQTGSSSSYRARGWRTVHPLETRSADVESYQNEMVTERLASSKSWGECGQLKVVFIYSGFYKLINVICQLLTCVQASVMAVVTVYHFGSLSAIMVDCHHCYT